MRAKTVKVWAAVHDDSNSGAGNGEAGGVKLDEKQQLHVNNLIAQEKKAAKEQLQKAMEEVESLKAKSSLTKQERDELDKRMQQLSTTMMTKEELHKKQVEDLEKSKKTEVETLAKDRDTWQQRFSNHLVTSTIVTEAATNKAYNPAQLVHILSPQTQIIEELDGSGKPTGKLVPIVKFSDKDKDGKPVTLDLPVPEAVKRMAKMPDFANLFKQDGAGGMGGTGNRGGGAGGSSLASAAKDPAAYRALRKQGAVK